MTILLFTDCAGYQRMVNRDQLVHQRVAVLDLGVNKDKALSSIGYMPDYITKERLEDGTEMECLVFKGEYCKPIMNCSPYVYILIFENNKLVKLDIREDIDKIRIEELQQIIQNRND